MNFEAYLSSDRLQTFKEASSEDEFILKLVHSFIAEAKINLKELKLAGGKDYEIVQPLLHKMNGSAKSIGYFRFYHLTEKAYRRLKQDKNTGDIVSLVEKLQPLLEDIEREILGSN